MAITLTFPMRAGPRPTTTTINPHEQLDQNAPPSLQQQLIAQVVAWRHVSLGDSFISYGSRAFLLDRAMMGGPPEAFLGPTNEFAHVHPAVDGSMHAKLPPVIGLAAEHAGWAEPHPMAARQGPPITNYMLYGPRDEAELSVVLQLLRSSYEFALGERRRGQSPPTSASVGRA